MLGYIAVFVLGILVYPAYKLHRALKSEGWDSSNVNNFLRTEGHLGVHPEDFGKMWYLSPAVLNHLENNTDFVRGEDYNRPFHYISKDEFSENFPGSRPH